jgi:hypothetical protein
LFIPFSDIHRVPSLASDDFWLAPFLYLQPWKPIKV